MNLQHTAITINQFFEKKSHKVKIIYNNVCMTKFVQIKLCGFFFFLGVGRCVVVDTCAEINLIDSVKFCNL